ncbi:MAG: ribosomal protein S18-alanine N-acetyltransferase [Myxococcota bacterium]
MSGVRPAQLDDAAAIARVERVAAFGPWPEASIASHLRSPVTRAWVVGDPVSGHLLTSCVAEEAEILTIAVDPSARRQGLATALLAACEAEWLAAGVRSAWLEVRVDNGAARALYAARGWIDAGTRRRYYADGADAQVMRWSPS